MSGPQLGTPPGPGEQRDAIHIAVAPVIAHKRLLPGERVGIAADGKTSTSNDVIGIVDPFNPHGAGEGSPFWLLLFPNTVYGMRHHWLHESFQSEASDDVTKARETVEMIAATCGKTFDEVMEAARLYAEHGDYEFDNSESYKDVDWEPFWPAYKVLTGKDAPEYGGAPYTCSC